MMDLILALIVFLFVVVTHIIYARLKAKQVLFARAFLILSILGFVLLVIILNVFSLPGLRLPITSLVLYLFLIPTYLIFYVSTLLVSPSKKIIQTLLAADGMTQDELLQSLNGEAMIEERLQDLCLSQCVCFNDGKYQLTPMGMKLFQWLIIYRFYTGRPGEG